LNQIKLLLITLFTFCLVFCFSGFSQESEVAVKPSFRDEIKLKDNYTEQELLELINQQEKGLYKYEPNFISYIVQKSESFKGSNTLVYAEICFRIAERLTKIKKPYEAYEYLDAVSTIIENKDFSLLPFAVDFFHLKGNYFYNFRRYKESKELLLKALNLMNNSNAEKINILNTLGLVYRKLDDIDSSFYYFNSALRIAKKSDIKHWIGIINGNLGYNYFQIKDIINSKKSLQIDQDFSLESNQKSSAVLATSFMIEINLLEKNYEMLELNMRILDSLMVNVKDLLLNISYYHVKTLYWDHLENYEKAYECHRKSISFKDSSNMEYDELNLQNMIFQIEFQKKKNENDLIIEKEKRKGQFFYSIAIIFSVIILACIFIIYLLRKRKIYERKILGLENEQFQTELKRNEAEITQILKNLVKKNEIIEDLNKEIQKREKMKNNLNLEKEKLNLHEKINSLSLLTENDLLVFKQLFDKIHPSFYDSLLTKCDDLTKSEARLAMLIRLNLTSIEMSRILGISQDSVRKSNLRLRKKLSIDSQKELVQFIKAV